MDEWGGVVGKLSKRCIWVVLFCEFGGSGCMIILMVTSLSVIWSHWACHGVSLSLASELERCSIMASKLTMLVMSVMTILSTVHSGTHLGRDTRNVQPTVNYFWNHHSFGLDFSWTLSSDKPWFRWENGEVPFYFNATVTNDDRIMMRHMMKQIEKKSCVRFREKTRPPSGHHLEIQARKERQIHHCIFHRPLSKPISEGVY